MKPPKLIERGKLEVTALRLFPFDGGGVWYFGGGEKKRREGETVSDEVAEPQC